MHSQSNGHSYIDKYSNEWVLCIVCDIYDDEMGKSYVKKLACENEEIVWIGNKTLIYCKDKQDFREKLRKSQIQKFNSTFFSRWQ